VRLKQYLDNLFIARSLAADARAGGLDKDPVLARQIAMAVDKLLAQAQVDRIEASAAAAFDQSAEKYTARARELYDVNRSRYAVPERVKAAHILVKINDGDKAAALAKATEIRARLGRRRLRAGGPRIVERPDGKQEQRRIGYFEPSRWTRLCCRRIRDDEAGRDQRASAYVIRISRHPVRGPQARGYAHLR
jgi:hypothetical protein